MIELSLSLCTFLESGRIESYVDVLVCVLISLRRSLPFNNTMDLVC
jgi:hypothetical protein